MSRELPYIADAGDAVGFYRWVVLEQMVNLNPDEGFICAEGRSRFESIDDETARALEAANREAIEALRSENIDAWEIMQHMSMLMTFADHARNMRKAGVAPNIFTEALMRNIAQTLIPFLDGSGHIAARGIPTLAEEDEDARNQRRSSFIIDWISRYAQGSLVQEVRSETMSAVALPAELLPPLWGIMVERHVARISDAKVESHWATDEDIGAVIQASIDAEEGVEGDIDNDDNDDDPFGWDA